MNRFIESKEDFISALYDAEQGEWILEYMDNNVSKNYTCTSNDLTNLIRPNVKYALRIDDFPVEVDKGAELRYMIPYEGSCEYASLKRL